MASSGGAASSPMAGFPAASAMVASTAATAIDMPACRKTTQAMEEDEVSFPVGLLVAR